MVDGLKNRSREPASPEERQGIREKEIGSFWRAVTGWVRGAGGDRSPRQQGGRGEPGEILVGCAHFDGVRQRGLVGGLVGCRWFCGPAWTNVCGGKSKGGPAQWVYAA